MALQQIVEQTVTGLGYDLVEIERSAGGLLRITIDLPWQAPEEGAEPLPEAFVTVEDCEKVTRQLQFAPQKALHPRRPRVDDDYIAATGHSRTPICTPSLVCIETQ